MVLDCISPGALGLEDHSIQDFQLNASSSSSGGYSQQYGRLNYDDMFGGWLHGNSDTDPWFEVNLFKDALISGVATQGGVQNNDMWMATFEMSYSIDGTKFLFYKFASQTKVPIKNGVYYGCQQFSLFNRSSIHTRQKIVKSFK